METLGLPSRKPWKNTSRHIHLNKPLTKYSRAPPITRGCHQTTSQPCKHQVQLLDRLSPGSSARERVFVQVVFVPSPPQGFNNSNNKSNNGLEPGGATPGLPVIPGKQHFWDSAGAQHPPHHPELCPAPPPPSPPSPPAPEGPKGASPEHPPTTKLERGAPGRGPK